MALKPSAADSLNSGSDAGDRCSGCPDAEADLLDMPLGARPSGRFFLLSNGCEPVVELDLVAFDLFSSPMRSAVTSSSDRGGGCASTALVVCGRLLGDLGGDAGLDGDTVRERDFRCFSSLDDTSSFPFLEVWLVFP